MRQGEKIAALLLAAGYSSRMGEFKPLLPLGERTVIETAVHSFLRAGVEDVRVVLGHRAEQLAAVTGNTGIKTVLNENYPQGMYSSVKAGVKSLGPGVEAFFLLPVDNPLIKRRTLVELIRASRETRADITYPCFEGERGHPPLISTMLTEAILSWDRQGGLRSLLEEYDSKAVDVEVIDQGTLMDMDTPEDYRLLTEYYNRKDIPTVRECRAIFKKYAVPERVVAHCRAVAVLSEKMARLLNGAGCNVDTALVETSALLHDLARGRSDHAGAGADILRELGFPRVAEIVASHMDIIPSGGRIPVEAELVYLADKMVRGDIPVTLEMRFAETRGRLAGDQAGLKAAEKRLENAENIKSRVEAALGMPLEKLLVKGSIYE